VIYCVVPEALAAELLDKLINYYADDPKVTVIVETCHVHIPRIVGAISGRPAGGLPAGEEDD